jgi:hypothetical protein
VVPCFLKLICIFNNVIGSDFDDSDDDGSDDEDGDDDDNDESEKKTKKKKSKDKDKDKKSSKSSRRAGEVSGVRAELQQLKSELPGDGEDERQYPISVPNDRGASGYRVEVLKEFYRSYSNWCILSQYLIFVRSIFVYDIVLLTVILNYFNC